MDKWDILNCDFPLWWLDNNYFPNSTWQKGCVLLGNPDFEYYNRTRNRTTNFISEKSVLRVDSIKKSKSRFHGFPFYRSIGKSEKGFAKLFSWTAVFFLLIMRVHARPLFLRTVFQILFRISQSNGKKENPKTNIAALKSVFGFRVRLQIRNLDFKI